LTAKVEKGNFIKSLFLGGVVGFMLLAGIFILSNKYFFRKVDNNPRLAGLEKSLQDIRAAMNIDSVRQFNIKKIMNIIEKYNPDLPSGMKYEIANEVFNTSVKYTNLEVDLICALITHESGGTWDPDIVSESGAMGLLQIMPTIGLWIAHFEGITWTSSSDKLTLTTPCRSNACTTISFCKRSVTEGKRSPFSTIKCQTTIFSSASKLPTQKLPAGISFVMSLQVFWKISSKESAEFID